MKKIFIISAAILILIPFAASAALIEKDTSYTLSKEKTVATNVYAMGSSIMFLGNASEDLLAVGGTIVVSGNVSKDLSLAGGTINISGETGEDVRVGGGTINLDGKVGGELAALGGQIIIGPGAEVKKDSYIIGGNILINGHLGQYLVIKGETVTIDGVIDGSVKITASEKITIGSSAQIKGALDYSAPHRAEIEEGAKISGAVTYKQYIVPKTGVKTKGAFILWMLVKGLMVLLAAVVVSLLIKKQTQAAVRYALPNFGKELLRGFIILVVLPVAVIISFITVFGGILGGAALLLYITMAFFGAILSPIILGALLAKYIFKQTNFEGDWKSAILGSVVWGALYFVPYIGKTVCFVFFLAAFGTLFNFLYKHFREAEK
ncbi:MAG: hypothetical protein A2Y98_01765 [Candidatus Portnoybacteria bacterium RBG_19FT_COMBO_36_7]|uniref:Polymer-forming cytoskeletal protein n=1 Tax=Candidatus Portnoybacteria bacterium RBG_19FT_COMBO_36_7 TaxID=1801992 RepID=A0A1G2F6G9_9BACT|nr:MAG: hypothetical protein A2Y98_01765 [Candidatus Portnoybacteria bacterium RBG_19FT_COMBO_36_7]